jgi:ribonucleotide reductase alpha subunit
MTKTIILKKNNEQDIFSIEKLTISFFKLTYLIGEPNLELSEKLAKTIQESLSKRRIEQITINKFTEEIKELLLDRKHVNLYNAFITKNTKKEIKSHNILRDKVLSYLFNNTNYAENINLLKEKFSDTPELINKIINYIDAGVFYPSTNILTNTKHNYMNSSRTHVIEDKLEEICYGLLKNVKNNKYNLPTSINVSKIRSKEEKVSSTNKNANGIKNVIDFYVLSQKLIIDNSFKNTKNLFYLTIEHRDIIDILSAETFNNINIVLLINNRFMKYYSENKEYYLKKENDNFIETTKEEASMIVNPQKIIDLLFLKILENKIFDVIFIDKLESKNQILNTKQEISPIGYQPVYDDDGFVTGIIDVSKFVKLVGSVKTFDWNKLKETIENTIIFLDTCIDKTKYIYTTYEENNLNYRRIYLSITGYYNLLNLLDVPYDSDDSLLFGENLSEFIAYYSKKTSINISKEKRPFLNYNKSKYVSLDFFNYSKGVQKTLFSELTKARKLLSTKPVIDWDELKNEQKKYGLRNLTTYSILFSDLFSFANQTTNSINPPTNYKYINIFNENNLIESVMEKPVNNLFLIKLQNVFEKYCDGVCNINLFYKNNQSIDDLKKDFLNTFISNNTCFLPRLIINKEVYILDSDAKKILSI